MTKFIGLCIVAAGVLLWMIGGNVVVARHYKRRGMPMESGFQPLAYPFKQFNLREWVMLAVILAASVALAAGGAMFLPISVLVLVLPSLVAAVATERYVRALRR